jgi:hypothetical protein
MDEIHDEREIPTTACRFSGGAIRFEAGESNASSVPIRMLARTSQPIEHWYWGRCIHDMAGMLRHKDVLPADYCHEEECGFLDTFEFDDQQNLIVSGKLVATSAPDDIARKIIERSKGGVPYEASIDFGGDGIVVEEVSEGFIAEVNGYQFEGPGAIIRQWPLRGVAVCPYGADMNTQTSLSAKTAANLRCKFMKANPTSEIKEVSSMTDTAVQETESVVATEVVAESVVSAEAQTEVATPSEVVTSELSNGRAEAARFKAAFGEQGCVWFADGLTFDEAREREVTVLRQMVAELTKKLAARGNDGELEPIGFDAADQRKRGGLSSKIRMK